VFRVLGVECEGFWNECSVFRFLEWVFSVQCSVECVSACNEQLVFIVLGDGRPAVSCLRGGPSNNQPRAKKAAQYSQLTMRYHLARSAPRALLPTYYSPSTSEAPGVPPVE
jgi:hypothetical protein